MADQTRQVTHLIRPHSNHWPEVPKNALFVPDYGPTGRPITTETSTKRANLSTERPESGARPQKQTALPACGRDRSRQVHPYPTDRKSLLRHHVESVTPPAAASASIAFFCRAVTRSRTTLVRLVRAGNGGRPRLRFMPIS